MKNKAAERLFGYIDVPDDFFREELEEALATERRATVERIREAVQNSDTITGWSELGRILDEEAAR